MASRGCAHEPVVGFQSTKAAQIAAFFVSKAGGRIEKMKLAKLSYLSEREFLDRYDTPMTYDELYSLPHGPICSSALNGIDGNLRSRAEWRRFQNHGKDHVHGHRVTREQLDELSDAEYGVLEDIWNKFGRMSANQVRAYTHVKENVPEYTDVTAGRYPIRYEDILTALGKDDGTIEFISREIEEHRQLEIAFNR